MKKMKTKILITILTVGALSISTMKAQVKPMNMKQDTIKMDHSKMKMMDKSIEVEIKHELMEIDNMYTCPMHGDVKSDKPGACPKCGMDLKMMEMKQDSIKMNMDHSKMGMNDSKMGMDHSKMNHDQMEKVAFVCPMHPEVTSDKPGECSKCGMELKKMDMKKVDTPKKHKHQ
jgi:hypothetical protein